MRAFALHVGVLVSACGNSATPPEPSDRNLAFVVQPTRTATDSVLTPAPQVAIQVLTGHTDTASGARVTIALRDNAGQSTLHGTLAVNAVRGIAVFPGLRISGAGDLQLVASAANAGDTYSLRFRVFPRYSTIAAGGEHSCATSTGGSAYCWGRKSEGQLGTAATPDTLIVYPVAVPAGVSFTVVGAGGEHSCGLTPTGAAYCWGSNLFNQLGDGTGMGRSTPVPVSSPGVNFSTLSVAHWHSCAATPAGAAYCWGLNVEGALGDGTTVTPSAPVAVSLPLGVTFAAVSAGFNHSCAVTAPGAGYCWGANVYGALGNGTTTASLTPVPVSAPGGVNFVAISAGDAHTCGLTAAGAAYCWGRNDVGQLGDGTLTSRSSPVLVAAPAGVGFSRIAAGRLRTCGVAGAAGLYCWGRNGQQGLLGDSTTIDQAAPVRVAAAAGVNFASVSIGAEHTCALTPSGVGYCWGYNGFGQLADSTGLTRMTPVPVGQ